MLLQQEVQLPELLHSSQKALALGRSQFDLLNVC